MSAVFVSHSSKNNEWARRVLSWLIDLNHHSVFVDFDEYVGIRAGVAWEQTVYRKLRESSAVVCLVSPDWVNSKWCFAEITQARALGKLVIPLIIQPSDASVVFNDVQMVPVFDMSEAQAKARLTAALKAARLAESFPYAPSRGPYPGLLSFEEDDAGVFFGRECETDDCLDRIRRLDRYAGNASRLLLILGPSGAGKSSLLRAGVIPRLRRTSGGRTLVGPLRPLVDDLEPILASAREAEHGDGVLLLVDQLEEAVSPSGAAFLVELRRILERSAGRVVAVATLRSDALEMIQACPAMRGFTDYEEFRLDFMDPHSFHDLVEKPAARADVTFESTLGESLVDRILADADDGASLPLVAFCLRQIYFSAIRDGRSQIRFADYESIGGLKGAVRTTAEEQLATARATDADRRALFDWITWNLVRMSEDGQLLRQRALLSATPSTARLLVDRFIDSRLLTKGEERGEATIEIAHEAMLKAWPVLSEWLDDHRALLLWRRRIAVDVSDWERSGKRRSFLLRGGKLAEAIKWIRVYRDRIEQHTADFVDRSVQWNRILKGASAVAVSAVAVILALAAVFARRQADNATREALVRQSERLASESLRSDQADLSALLAVSALQVANTPASIGALLDLAYNRQLPAVVVEPGQNVESIAYAPKGDLIATGHGEGVIRLWSSDRLTLAGAELHGPPGSVSCLAFSPDQRLLISCHSDFPQGGIIAIWDLATKRLSRPPFKAHESGIRSLAVSLDGGWLATGGELGDSAVRLWRMDDFSLVASAERVRGGAQVAFSADGQRIAVGTQQGQLIFLSVPGLEAIGSPREFNPGIASVALDPKGDWVVLGFQGGAIRFVPTKPIDPAQLKPNGAFSEPAGPIDEPIHEHKGAVWSLAYSPDGTIVASGSEDGIVHLWHADTRRLLTPPAEARFGNGTNMDRESGTLVRIPFLISRDPHGVPTLMVGTTREFAFNRLPLAFAPDGDRLATAFRGAFQIWSDLIGRPVQRSRVGRSRRDVAGPILAVAKDTRVVFSHLGKEAGPAETSAWTNDPVDGVALNEAGTRAMIIGASAVHIIDASSGKPTSAKLPRGSAHAFAGDGSTVAVADAASRVTVYDTRTGRAAIGPVSVASEVSSVALSQRGSLLAIGRHDGVLQVVDVRTGRDVCKTAGTAAPIVRIGVSHDDGRIVSADQQHVLRIWDARRCLQSGGLLTGHTDTVLAVRFSPSGNRLVSSADDHTLRVWDVGSTRPIGSPLNTGQSAQALAFTDEDTIVASTEANAWTTYALSPVVLAARACERTRRNLSLEEWRTYFGNTAYQRTCPTAPVHPSLLDAARRRAGDGWKAEALELFRWAKGADPELELDAEREVAVAYALGEADRLAQQGDVNAAVGVLQQAKTFDPTLAIDPERIARRTAISALIEQGYRLARQNRTAEAVSALSRAWALVQQDTADADRALAEREQSASTARRILAAIRARGVDAVVKSEALRALLSEAEARAAFGDVEGAERNFTAAGAIEPRYAKTAHADAVRLTVAGLLREGRGMFARGDMDAARRALQRAKALSPDTAPDPDAEIDRLTAADAIKNANGLAASGDLALALQTLERASVKTASSKESLAAEGRRLVAQSHRDAARRFLQAGRRMDAIRELTAIASNDPTFSIDVELQVLSVPYVDAEGLAAYRVYATKGGAKAFAISEDGSYGWASEYPSMAKATEAAMLQCVRGGMKCRIYARGNQIVWNVGPP